MLYGIVADIHANLEAFQTVLEKLKEVDKLICVGDLVGYGPNPNECISLAREKEIITVAGNHDKAVIGELDTKWFHPNALQSLEWTQKQLFPDNSEYLKRLPLTFELTDFMLVHGSLLNPLEEYIFTIGEADGTIRVLNHSLCFVGHTHKPLYVGLKPSGGYDGRPIGKLDQVFISHYDKCLINPGSVGQPRDGDFRASYGVYDSEENVFTLYKVEYDIAAVQTKMRAAELPQQLIDRLITGD